jgi:hypothetical protein
MFKEDDTCKGWHHIWGIDLDISDMQQLQGRYQEDYTQNKAMRTHQLLLLARSLDPLLDKLQRALLFLFVDVLGFYQSLFFDLGRHRG